MNPSDIQQKVAAVAAAIKTPIQLLPYRHTKVVHFVRHGEGYHNLVGDYENWDYVDAHLTPNGWKQTEALRKHIRHLPEPLDLQVVVISPLTRAIETAIGAFGGDAWHAGNAEPLMVAQDSIEAKRAAHAAVSSAGCARFLLHEGCREHLGCNPCDKRTDVSTLRKRYPGLDFSDLQDDEDTLWKTDVRETTEQLMTRAVEFVQWLMKRPERRMAVVTHSSFLYHLMANFGHQASQPVKEELHKWYHNCEMRSIILSDPTGASSNADPYHFEGSLPAAEKNLDIAKHAT